MGSVIGRLGYAGAAHRECEAVLQPRFCDNGDVGLGRVQSMYEVSELGLFVDGANIDCCDVDGDRLLLIIVSFVLDGVILIVIIVLIIDVCLGVFIIMVLFICRLCRLFF